MFKIKSDFKPIGEQQRAATKLLDGLANNVKDQVLLGVTGSGKTFTMAQVIEQSQLPTLIISHNKTLAGQLFTEMSEFFPDNAVSYFVSYYDFYQPEAYMPASDTYIEKEAQINDYIDKMRLKATANLMTHDDTIVVASVSCIYNLGSPVEYGKYVVNLKVGESINSRDLMKHLVELQYARSEFDFKRGTFRLRGNIIDIFPSYTDEAVRVQIDNETITSLTIINTLTGVKISDIRRATVYPAKHYMIDKNLYEEVSAKIRHDLKIESDELKKAGKVIEAERLIKKVIYDLEMIREIGYVNGIENYSSYFDTREPGDPPYTLVDYFKHRFGDKWLCIIDESHMSVSQIRGMFNGDFARKKTLIDYGFRLKSALDNRPMKFDEFYRSVSNIIYVSATPAPWEIERSEGHVVEQLVRPTGIVDPEVEVRSADNEIPNLIDEIKKRVEKKERVLVTTLTKRIAEDLSIFLKEQDIRAAYLHSDVKTLARTDILNKLRRKEFDVLIGVNLLREGLDLPEVTLVAILDADKAGFLRSRTSLVQTMGRAARNIDGTVILYANKITEAMKEAIDEVRRRRAYQLEYNKKEGITPKTISKKIVDSFQYPEDEDEAKSRQNPSFKLLEKTLEEKDINGMTDFDKKKYVRVLERQMRDYVDDLNFESAILIRDRLREIK